MEVREEGMRDPEGVRISFGKKRVSTSQPGGYVGEEGAGGKTAGVKEVGTREVPGQQGCGKR